MDNTFHAAIFCVNLVPLLGICKAIHCPKPKHCIAPHSYTGCRAFIHTLARLATS